MAPVSEDKRDEQIESENSSVTLQEAGGTDGVEKELFFKVPSNKRKIIDKMFDAKISKRSEVQEDDR